MDYDDDDDEFFKSWLFGLDLGCVQNKLQHLSGQHSDVLESLTPKVRKRVEVLREIQVCVCAAPFWW